MEGTNFTNDSHQEMSAKHLDLLKAIAQLDKSQKVKIPVRSEPTLEVSEFHLVKSGVADNDSVNVDHLVQLLGGNTQHREINKKFNLARKHGGLLSRPLEKPSAEKLKREIGFENTQVQLKQWNAIVSKNRVAEKSIFPLEKPVTSVETTDKYIPTFQVQSDLQKELAKLELQHSNNNSNVEDIADNFQLTLKEMQEKRKELAKLRAQQSYKHAKASRIKKIKSKKFHRIEKKIKTKQQLKELEKLQDTDPQRALEELELLDKTRALERMSLRHKSIGKWAQNKQIRAKYDQKSRQALAQQLAISRELTEKIKRNDDNSDENDENDSVPLVRSFDENNPWISSVKTEKEVDDFISSYCNYWKEKNQVNSKEKNTKTEDIKYNNNSNKNNNNDNDDDDETMFKKTIDEENVEVLGTISPVKVFAEESVSSHKIINKKSKNPKLSMNKLTGSKSFIRKKKEVKIKEKVGTSEWCVKSTNHNRNDKNKNIKNNNNNNDDDDDDDDNNNNNKGLTKKVEIDEIFNDMDQELQKKVTYKVNQLKRKLVDDTINNTNERNNVKLVDQSSDLSFKKVLCHPEIDDTLDEVIDEFPNELQKNISKKHKEYIDNLKIFDKTSLDIDPSRFIRIESRHMNTKLQNKIEDEKNDSDGIDNEHQQNIISEAFADDNVVNEFKKEKEQQLKKFQLVDVDTAIPGWGCWGGKDIKIPKSKKPRFMIKNPENLFGKDKYKENVIIVEEKNPKLEEHLVHDLPYPFKSVADFESAIRAPIGRNFVPENVHKHLIESSVQTKMGHIIDPINGSYFFF